MTSLQQLLEQKASIDAAIRQERERIEADNDRRLEAWRAERRSAENSALAEAQRTGRNQVFIDDGTEVTVTAGGHVFYNMGDWY